MVHITSLADGLMMAKTICDQGGSLGGFRDGDCRTRCRCESLQSAAFINTLNATSLNILMNYICMIG